MSDTQNFSAAFSSFEHSETIGKLSEALAKASGGFEMAKKDKENPAYKGSKYTPLENLIDATRPALSANGLAVLQLPKLVGQNVVVTTILTHASGEWISSDLGLPGTMRERFDAQSVGSGITYARRYAYQSILNIAGEVDDDGNAAAGVGSKEAAQEVGKAKLADYLEKSVQSVSDKTVTIIPGVRDSDLGLELNVVYFVANEALAVLMEQGLKDLTQFDPVKKSRWMIDEPEPIGILEKIAKQFGFKLFRKSSQSVAKPEAVPSPRSAASVPVGGPIVKSVSEIQMGKKARYFTIEWDGKKAGCFHVDWHPFLLEAVGKPAYLNMKQNGQYWNLEGVISTDGNLWHEGAPSLQNELR